MSKNDVLTTAKKIARRSIAEREAEYTEEIQRLLDAGLRAMVRCGTTTTPRVADIVSDAQVSNEAFYRHFSSKEDLVQAISDAGSERLKSYLQHQMSKQATPEAKIEAWIKGVMAQAADPKVAEPTRAVLWNAGHLTDRTQRGSSSVVFELADLLIQPLDEISSVDPRRDATAIHAMVFTRMQQCLQNRELPTKADIRHLVTFCLRAVRPLPNYTFDLHHTGVTNG